MGFEIYSIEGVMDSIMFFKRRYYRIEVLHGKGRNRKRMAFDFNGADSREDVLGRLAVFLSEKSLTHNIKWIGGEDDGILKLGLKECERAVLNSNIDADMIETILCCLKKRVKK